MKEQVLIALLLAIIFPISTESGRVQKSFHDNCVQAQNKAMPIGNSISVVVLRWRCALATGENSVALGADSVATLANQCLSVMIQINVLLMCGRRSRR